MNKRQKPIVNQKYALPLKLQKLTIKIKSYAFMKIFMNQSTSPKKYHKVRHYDIQLEGATLITGWIKNKLQQQYLRYFYQIKNYYNNTKSSSTLIQKSSQQYLASLSIQANKKSSQRIRCITDRQKYLKPTIQKSKQVQTKQSRKIYRSQYGQQSQQSKKSNKSNLQNLLQKVRQVNNQSKLQKQNQSKSNNYQPSYQNSRVVSSGGYLSHDYNGKTNRTVKVSYQDYNSKYVNSMKYHNDLSFCKYGPTERPYEKNVTERPITHQQYNGYDNRLNKPTDRPKYNSSHVKQFQTPGTPGTPGDKLSYQINIQQEACLDKSNLLSLKKWHKNQKRNVIINKIKQLQSSLFSEYSKQPEYGNQMDYSRGHQFYYNEEDDFYPQPGYHNHQPTANYSQAYLNYKSRQPARSVIDVRLRK